MTKRCSLTILALLAACGQTLAEDPKPKDAALGEMVVTATRTEKELADSPGSVSVVTREKLGHRNINFLILFSRLSPRPGDQKWN